ncbi:alkylation response protein AidB-like acyl-CoA dehydrogenase [Paraburkholderia sp. BL27I4N3]|uniref:acyl-CoA dehydrogenase family protein n=1 Tax=Paraburkholderia sp. BL27I4N3 TaxID=1938805 RepID=UPI000E23DC61|nr:acyl-CoA dehydrogenase family protein [Paraburkholderia sp. BL27I4N3]REE18153.1 alkylation response protein AidB-like acyl-CoA dehydrogenase [Paraburkholderia sp. BL27I4N3]
MSTFEFSDEEKQIVEAVRRFVSKEVRPQVAKLEREQTFPTELLAGITELGLFGLAVPEQYGGLQLRVPVFAAVMEVLAAGWTTLAAYINSHATVAYVIATHGTEEQKSKYLPTMALGEDRGALCLTEPGAGSDLQSITTVGTLDGDNYRIRGDKIFVTNGEKATVLLTLTRTGKDEKTGKPRLSLFLVEKKAPGVSVGSTFHKMGFGLVDTVEIRLEDAQVSAASLVGLAEGAGLRQLLDGLEIGRIAIASSAVGLAANALDEATRYASERKAFGVAIDRHQAVQLRLAEMATKLVAARLLTAEAARKKEAGERADMLSAMAKLYASEACVEIAQDALRVHGGYGYINEFAIERIYREAPLYLVGEGTNDINKLVIARRMLEGGEADTLGLPS